MSPGILFPSAATHYFLGEIDMTLVFPAVFKEHDNGSYECYFPDLECCTAEGDSFDDTVRNAIDAAYNWIMVELEEDEPDLPMISSPEEITLKEGESIHNISVHIRLNEGWDE